MHTVPATMTNFLNLLRDEAAKLVDSDLPSNEEVRSVLGAVANRLARLEEKVVGELLPAPAPPAAAEPATTAPVDAASAQAAVQAAQDAQAAAEAERAALQKELADTQAKLAALGPDTETAPADAGTSEPSAS